MADLAQVPDYGAESDYLAHITRVLLHLVKYTQEHPVRYIPAMRVYAILLFGVKPTIKVHGCDSDPECVVDGPQVGGIDDVLTAIDEAFDCFALEEDFDAPSFQRPADYDI